MLRNLMNLRVVSQRAISSSTRRPVNRVAEKQKLFQEDNGLPIHLKGGVADSLLFRATMVLSIAGTGYVLYELFRASQPKKQD
ncbi:cytochrome c oxidase subunit 7A2, mitochondrial [Pelodytes ibericus]